MFHNYTTTFSLVFLMVVNFSVAMEESLSGSDSSSGLLGWPTKSLTESVTESIKPYMPTSNGIYNSVVAIAPTRDGLYNVCNAVYSTAGSIYEKAVLPAATSLYNTASIAYDDNKALIKLGYPITNKDAQAELKKTLDNYIEYFNLQRQLSKGEVNYNDTIISQKHNHLSELVGRRIQFVERFANKELLERRSDGLYIAEHLITYHDNAVVMSASHKNIITLFMIAQKKAEEDAKANFVKLLTDAQTAFYEMQEANKANTEKDNGK